MLAQDSYRIEDCEVGRALVVTGLWTEGAERVVASGDVDELVLNYGHGFSEPSLDFLDAWPIRHLRVLDRNLVDLGPIGRLSETLEGLSVEAGAAASLDLGEMARLYALAGEWDLIRWQVRITERLRRLTTWRYGEDSLLVLNEHVSLEHLTIKDAPRLQSLLGAEQLAGLTRMEFRGVRGLTETGPISDLVELKELTIEEAPQIHTLDELANLTNLRRLGVEDCGDIKSLAPLKQMTQLSSLYAWGSTRILDGDLTPLLSLTNLTDLRMRPRTSYTPPVSDILAALGIDQ